MSTIITIVIIAILAIVIKELKHGKWQNHRGRKRYDTNNKFSSKRKVNYPVSEIECSESNYDISSYEKQLKFVSSNKASFTAQKLMKVGEFKVFQTIESKIIPSFKGCRVFAQVSLGEILYADKLFHSCINSKRVDMLVISPFGMPLVVIEYQGSGHYQGTAALRDAVKKEALRKAGITYVEITESNTEQDIQYLVTRALENALNHKDDIKHKTVDNATSISH